jgi:hypothetical protein
MPGFKMVESNELAAMLVDSFAKKTREEQVAVLNQILCDTSRSGQVQLAARIMKEMVEAPLERRLDVVADILGEYVFVVEIGAPAPEGVPQ